MRVFDRQGETFGTMTPLKGLTFVYNEIYLNEKNSSEVWYEFIEWADNPYLSKKEIKCGDVIYRENDKVLQLVNDPDNNIFNGDMGSLTELLLFLLALILIFSVCIINVSATSNTEGKTIKKVVAILCIITAVLCVYLSVSRGIDVGVLVMSIYHYFAGCVIIIKTVSAFYLF